MKQDMSTIHNSLAQNPHPAKCATGSRLKVEAFPRKVHASTNTKHGGIQKEASKVE